MDKLVTRKEVLKVLKIHYHTLYAMVERGDIETVKLGKKSLYNLDKYLRKNGVLNQPIRRKICYCRVSSNKQKEDLKRQVEYMRTHHPNSEILSEIGSGLNFKREKLLKIIELAIKGEIEELIITYKDRLARFGYDLIEWIITKYSNGKITIINNKEEMTPSEELVKDILSIMNVFVAKINGLRKYKNKIKDHIEQSEYNKI